MLNQITGQAASCYLREEAALLQAKRASSEIVSKAYLDVAGTWRRLAQSYEMAERISGFLDWQAERLRR
jgi:hypothetical protein